MERNLGDYQKLIKKMARLFLPSFQKLGVDVDDLISEGYETFVDLCRCEATKPLSCSFYTALRVQIQQRFINKIYDLKTKKRGGETLFLSFESLLDSQEKDLQDQSLISNPCNKIDAYIDLPFEIKVVVQLLQDTPSELAMLSKSFGIQESISKYLKMFKGWKPRQIQKLKRELALVTK
jgi:hypothetical protein